MGSHLVQVCPVGHANGGEKRWGRIWYRSILEALHVRGRIDRVAPGTGLPWRPCMWGASSRRGRGGRPPRPHCPSRAPMPRPLPPAARPPAALRPSGNKTVGELSGDFQGTFRDKLGSNIQCAVCKSSTQGTVRETVRKRQSRNNNQGPTFQTTFRTLPSEGSHRTVVQGKTFRAHSGNNKAHNRARSWPNRKRIFRKDSGNIHGGTFKAEHSGNIIQGIAIREQQIGNNRPGNNDQGTQESAACETIIQSASARQVDPSPHITRSVYIGLFRFVGSRQTDAARKEHSRNRTGDSIDG
jgi:hypothetical protein